ncbi:GntR family transcriptional regulator [Paenibacillus cremeus]|uniref:GntR family transcriptional regulator n=1 Tax=Paenibacillus cremeus TaxID=2163881 RepID=A0A559KFJ7_9BACL|nr:GntR family transcriptional regulator [Paenibacillus cremeus]TVY10903.1 GntR family transcriptional regulator [Paenibacillus cremeus]
MSKKLKPKHEQLKEQILEWIHTGKFKPGDQLPTEHEIAELSAMSRQTVRQGIGALVQEGWLSRRQGSGTFVADGPGRKSTEVPTIGVMTTNISDYIFPEIVRGTESVLRRRGYRMLLSSTDNEKAKERDNLKQLLSSPIQGLIIEPTKSAQGNPNLDCYLSLDYSQIPYLMINERYAELDCPSVKVDDEQGGYLATKHLIDLGHRRIAGFFKTDDLQGVQRLKGFMRAHREHSVPLLPEAVVHYTTETKEHAPEAAATAMLLQGEERPTAFVCYNDQLAVRLFEAVRQAALRVPGDVSVVGFDDSFLATATEIKLTTISHPKAELGITAAELLLDLIEGQAERRGSDVVYRPELIVRESTHSLEAAKPR